MNKVRQIASIAVFGVLILTLTAFLWLSPDKDISLSERRPLTQFEAVLNEEKRPQDEKGELLPLEEIVEKYLLDQFPLRDSFRQLKAFLYMNVFKKNDNNDIYQYNDTVIKIEDKLDEKGVEHTINVSNNVVNKYFKDNDVYFSIIPDKHYYASKENGYPAMDYEKLISMMKEGMPGEYIDITDKLALSDYYKTDSHWSQDKITDVSQHLISTMQNKPIVYADGYWNIKTLSPFYGVYYGQSALSLPPEQINYLTNDVTDGMTMTLIDNMGKPLQYKVYIEDMFNNKDPYDIFLAGAQQLITIENPSVNNGKELVLFRDSFGSSIAPLLACHYEKVYVIDLRYVVPDMLPSFYEFNQNQDILFMYSTGLINGAQSIMKNFLFLS